MPNLVGIYDRTATASALERDLAKMMKIVDIPDYRYARKRVCGRNLVCGNVLPGIADNLAQPARDRSRGVWLMLDGEILGTDVLCEELKAAGLETTGLDDAQLALAAYKAFGEDFLNHLNGRWNLVLHHAPSDTTIIASDRYGSRLLYWSRDAERLVFASELKAVILARPVESRAGGYGLLELFMGPYLHGDRTWVEGIHVLKPGTILRIRPDGIQQRRYWKSHFNEGDYSGSVDDAAEEFKVRLQTAVGRAMRKQAQHPLAITLSGGLDSRSLALSIDPKSRPIPALTYGDEDSADVRFARQLADVIGLDFHHVESQKEALFDASRSVLDELEGPSPEGPRGFFSTQIDRIIWRDEFFGDQTGVTSMIWHPLYSKHMNLMLQGACGDALTGSHIAWWQMKNPSRKQVIAKLFHEQYSQPKERLAEIFTQPFMAKYWGERNNHFNSLFSDIDADEPTAVSSIWDMENRQRRGAFSTFTMERYFCMIRVPYLDYELASFLSSLPPMWRFQQRVYKKMLINCYPEGAHVPWAYTQKPLTGSWTQEFARESFNYWSRRADSMLGSKSKKLPVYAFRDSAGLLRQDRSNGLAVYQWLESDRFDENVFNHSGIRHFMDRFYAGEDSGEDFLLVAYLCALARVDKYILSRQFTTIPDVCNPARFGVVGPNKA
jgi:asparagine synthetase B (glutamine-hydrolysing)